MKKISIVLLILASFITIIFLIKISNTSSFATYHPEVQKQLGYWVIALISVWGASLGTYLLGRYYETR